MKKLISLLSAFFLLFLCGCGNAVPEYGTVTRATLINATVYPVMQKTLTDKKQVEKIEKMLNGIEKEPRDTETLYGNGWTFGIKLTNDTDYIWDFISFSGDRMSSYDGYFYIEEGEQQEFIDYYNSLDCEETEYYK